MRKHPNWGRNSRQGLWLGASGCPTLIPLCFLQILTPARNKGRELKRQKARLRRLVAARSQKGLPFRKAKPVLASGDTAVQTRTPPAPASSEPEDRSQPAAPSPASLDGAKKASRGRRTRVPSNPSPKAAPRVGPAWPRSPPAGERERTLQSPKTLSSASRTVWPPAARTLSGQVRGIL